MLIKKLEIQEEIIANGLNQFYEVGNALARIRDEGLYKDDYKTFNDYCQDKWGFTDSNGYNLIGAASIVNSLNTTNPPERASHANKLKIITNDDLRQRAWNEITSSGDKITGKSVERVAQKYKLKEDKHFLYKSVSEGALTVDKALELRETLERLPVYYKDAVMKHGACDHTVLIEIRKLEWEFKTESLEILVTGYLQTAYDPIAFIDLSPIHIQSYKSTLRKENKRMDIESAKTKQQEIVSDNKIMLVSGSEVYTAVENKEKFYYVFPEDVSLKQVERLFEKEGIKVLFIACYDGNNEPSINFDSNNKVRPSSINGVKPQYMLDMFKSTVE